jgi:hypothetical protein
LIDWQKIKWKIKGRGREGGTRLCHAFGIDDRLHVLHMFFERQMVLFEYYMFEYNVFTHVFEGQMVLFEYSYMCLLGADHFVRNSKCNITFL